jgi:hypothetical protein
MKSAEYSIVFFLGWELQKRRENGDIIKVKTINKKRVFKLTVGAVP